MLKTPLGQCEILQGLDFVLIAGELLAVLLFLTASAIYDASMPTMQKKKTTVVPESLAGLQVYIWGVGRGE